jgi:hypothetical protein
MSTLCLNCVSISCRELKGHIFTVIVYSLWSAVCVDCVSEVPVYARSNVCICWLVSYPCRVRHVFTVEEKILLRFRQSSSSFARCFCNVTQGAEAPHVHG